MLIHFRHKSAVAELDTRNVMNSFSYISLNMHHTRTVSYYKSKLYRNWSQIYHGPVFYE